MREEDTRRFGVNSWPSFSRIIGPKTWRFLIDGFLLIESTHCRIYCTSSNRRANDGTVLSAGLVRRHSEQMLQFNFERMWRNQRMLEVWHIARRSVATRNVDRIVVKNETVSPHKRIIAALRWNNAHAISERPACRRDDEREWKRKNEFQSRHHAEVRENHYEFVRLCLCFVWHAHPIWHTAWLFRPTRRVIFTFFAPCNYSTTWHSRAPPWLIRNKKTRR